MEMEFYGFEASMELELTLKFEWIWSPYTDGLGMNLVPSWSEYGVGVRMELESVWSWSPCEVGVQMELELVWSWGLGRPCAGPLAS